MKLSAYYIEVPMMIQLELFMHIMGWKFRLYKHWCKRDIWDLKFSDPKWC